MSTEADLNSRPPSCLSKSVPLCQSISCLLHGQNKNINQSFSDTRILCDLMKTTQILCSKSVTEFCVVFTVKFVLTCVMKICVTFV